MTLVFGLKVQDFDLRRIAPIRDDWLRVYTPYFPGLRNLRRHEIFSPRYAHTKKIVLLGASATDAIGCDGTWSTPDPSRIPERNADASCSLAGQMNSLLKAEGVKDWRAFDLAREGSKLTSMLYVYAKLRPLKPEIVIFGDTFPYYLEENADAQMLSAGQYAEMTALFDRDPATRATWAAYLQNLRDHGWKPAGGPGKPSTQTDQPVTLHSLLYGALVNIHQLYQQKGPPLPIKIGGFRDWPPPRPSTRPFQNPDPGFKYFQGLTLIDRLQRKDGHEFLFYLSPQYDRRNDMAYQAGLDQQFGGYLDRAGVAHVSLVAMNLKPDLETFDGVHQTIYGNRRIAGRLLSVLRREGWMGAPPR